jgi:hypothetical protein
MSFNFNFLFLQLTLANWRRIYRFNWRGICNYEVIMEEEIFVDLIGFPLASFEVKMAEF